MSIVPRILRAAHARVTSVDRPATLAAGQKEETRSPNACRRKGTGLERLSHDRT